MWGSCSKTILESCVVVLKSVASTLSKKMVDTLDVNHMVATMAYSHHVPFVIESLLFIVK